MFLTDKQVAALTRRKRADAQARVLAESQIIFRMVDGRPVVPVGQFEAVSVSMPEPKLKLVK